MNMVMLASAGGSTDVESGIEKLIGLLPKGASIATAVWDFGMANPLIALGIVCAVVMLGARVIGSVRRHVR